MRGSTIHGVSRLFTWWFPRFDRERFDVKLYGLKNPDSASRAVEDEGVPIAYLGKSVLCPSTLSTFVDVIRRERADVIHLHGWIAANYGRIAGRMTGVPTIMHEHGVDPNFPFSQRIADRTLSPFTDMAVAVSISVKDFLVKYRSVSAQKVRVVYNGAPTSDFSAADPALVAREKSALGISAGSPVIGTIGRLDTQKGITYLLKAIPQILKSVPEARFLIVGDGPKRDELERESVALGLTEHVTFTGHRSDIPVIQSMLDIQVFPSLWEGTPLTVFEAMAMGRPIVSTSVDGLGEVLVNGESALVVEPSRPEKLSDGIVRLLSDRQFARLLGDNARAHSLKFDIEHTVRNLELLYVELSDGSKSRVR